MIEKLERQLKMEQEAHDYSYSRLIREIGSRIEKNQADELSEGNMILLHSIDKVANKLKEYFEADIRGKMKGARDLIALDYYEAPKDLAYIILVTIVRSISKDIQVPSIVLIRLLNRAIYDSLTIRRLDKDTSNLGAFVDKRYSNRSEQFRNREKLKISRRQEYMNERDLTDITTYLGGVLLDIVIKSGINIIELKQVYVKGKSVQYVLYTEECFKMVLQSRERLLSDYRKYPILIVPPTDWSSFNGTGGYYNRDLYKVPIIKARFNVRGHLKKYFEDGKVENIYKTLNSLQKTPWRVNQRVFEVMNQVFQNNVIDESCATNNPYLLGKLPYNGKLEPEEFVNVYDYGEIQTEGKYKGLPTDPKQMRRYFKDLEAQRDILISNTGKAIMLNLVMYNAQEYLNEEEFYFSYQYDFRGRIYPIQQHLQPQGKGEVKALLEFVNGVPIQTEEELYWFLIHGANCYGFDKDSYEDRVKKIKEKEEEIKLISEDPFKYRQLWKDADEPYLYLAWCFEYSDYLNDPATFRSHIPIALDATCSGIQIYSGLLRDKDGAEAVNVIGNSRNDIYQRVADKVEEFLQDGKYDKIVTYKTSDGKEHEQSTVAMVNSLKGNVTRKLTKRNTMTQPYSVTRFGMYEQLKAELQDMENNNKRFWVGDNWLIAKLLTDLNDRAIADVVKGARVGQEYLKDITADVVKKGGYIFFTTPLTNFPVLQKIHKTKMERVVTPIGKLSIRTTLGTLHKQKMVNGIAPNFIHSLDATLLAKTVLKLVDDGCTDFHLIHDSYGVPLNHVANLNKRVREAFIELFETEPLKRFVNQVNPGYEHKVEDVMINTLDLKEVANSSYIFS